ncbi:MAG: hypothetical protein BGP06_12625 [Rhizobiales bacterium 65-9]|nr:hypothetical protein [Hyphomicrobiales bacterium]OJY38370.1 MAG: hypothetical protein BGP06_12625 [Rhizobiales bacterium 65-9]
MTQAQINAVLSDNQRAQNVAAKYMQAVNGELYARGLIFTNAMQKFAKFLELEAIPPWYTPYLALASIALSVAQPELFLATFLKEKKEAVTLALTISAAAGSKTAKAAQTVQAVRDAAAKGKEVAGKVKDVYDGAKGAKEAVGKIADPETAPGADDLRKLDASKGVVTQLIAASRATFKIWSDALDALANEFENRLNDPGKSRSETLEQMASRLLAKPVQLSVSELDEVELLFLYEMIKVYVSNVVTVNIEVEDWTDDGGARIENVRYDGLNNNQIATIRSLFGSGVKRGNIFRYPAVADMKSTVIGWGSKSSQRVHKRIWTGRMQ